MGSHFATLQGLPAESVDPGGSINCQGGKSLCNFARITSGSVDPGGSIDSQLEKSLCNFARITSGNVDPGEGG